MDDIQHWLWAWKDVVAIVMAVIVVAALLYHAEKIWNSNATLTSILGVGLVGAALPLYFGWNMGISSRALSFTLIYVWCVMGMLFLAGRQTHIAKLLIGIASQGGIVYALFRLI